ncbi:MAG: general secretion pathway protein GspK [Deltaproteobacteria bacterium]|nr:general secretion pathway protein GspK [Deltaproteobacteria bacterium]
MTMDFRSPTNEKGIALFLVLWVLVLLSVIVGEFCHAMRTEINVTRNYKEQRQAYYIALAGFNRAVAELVREDFMGGTPVIGEEGVALLRSLTGKPVKEEGLNGERPEWRVNTEIPPEVFGGGSFQVRLGNESGKININEANESTLRMILGPFDLDEKEKSIIVDSILDWRDDNDLHRLNGAEDDYYRSLKRPYECRDADFETIEELLLVRGVTEELFYGGLDRMVTVVRDVVSAVKKPRKAVQAIEAAGNQKLNLNAASPMMLRALPGMTEEMVEAVMAFRKEADFVTLNDLVSAIGEDGMVRVRPFITLRLSPFYTVEVAGRVEESPVRQVIEALVHIDKREKTGYRILRWREGLRHERLEGM